MRRLRRVTIAVVSRRSAGLWRDWRSRKLLRIVEVPSKLIDDFTRVLT